MQLLVASFAASLAIGAVGEERRPATIAIYGEPGAARSDLGEHCVVFPTFNPVWLAKRPGAASFAAHLRVSRLPSDWRRTAMCEVGGASAARAPAFDWVVDEVGGRVFRRAGDGSLSLFSTQKWLVDKEPEIRSSFLASLVETGQDAEVFRCVAGCRAFQLRWAREPPRSEVLASITQILAVLGLSMPSEAVLVNAYLGEGFALGNDVSISFYDGRWFVHNAARTEAAPLAGAPNFMFYPHPEGCRLTAPSATVKAWEVNGGWLVHWNERPARLTVPFKAVANSPKEQCSLRNETVYVYTPTQLPGKPAVKEELRPMLDVLQHRPLASLPLSARKRSVLRYAQPLGWSEEEHDLEVRVSPLLLLPPGTCSPSDSGDGSYICPPTVSLAEFNGFAQWY